MSGLKARKAGGWSRGRGRRVWARKRKRLYFAGVISRWASFEMLLQQTGRIVFMCLVAFSAAAAAAAADSVGSVGTQDFL